MDDLLTKPRSAFQSAVLAGLSQQQKVLSARFFYDRRGSELFEAITQTPEYYPTRTEISLLETHAGDIERLTAGTHALVEFGSGSSRKTPILLNVVRPAAYVPIDISEDYLGDAALTIANAFPDLAICPVAADFTQPLRLPAAATSGPMLGFFPGSTIGNLSHAAAVDLLRAFRATLGANGRLLIGIDTRKNPRLLETAYDDSAGVTAEFNLNILHRINAELDGTIPVDAFEHRAVWHDALGRIEMHLVASRNVGFEVADRSFIMRAGETIHTENSYKYTLEEARLLARASGWEPLAAWSGDENLFCLHLWKVAGPELQP